MRDDSLLDLPLTSDSAAAKSQKEHIAGLDELRGLSILSVMWFHGTALWTWMPPKFAGYGYHSVVLFFIISGYLITRILIQDKDKPYYFSRFYVNRFFRIWPLMLVALAVSAVLWPEQMRNGIFNLLLINNYAYAYGLEPMTRTDVMWSLAIEEQFYLIWPVIIFLLGLRALPWAAAAIVLIGLSFDAGLIPAGGGIVSKTTHGAMQYIAMGALIATGRKGIHYLLAAWGTFFLFYLYQNGPINGLANFRWVWYGVSSILGILVAFTVHRRPLILWQPLAMVGKLCYGLYIIHFFISWVVLEFLGRGVVWPGAIYFAASFLLALLSYHYFEKPVLNLRIHVNASENLRVLLFAALGLTVLSCMVALITTMKPLH